MAANEETSSCCDGKSTSIVTRDEFNLADRLGCLFRREFYHIIPFYVLVLIPSASALAYLFARFVDPWIQSAVRWWVFPVAVPMRYYLFGLILAASGLGVLWVYSYLILEGGGGPCPPFTSKTSRLVVCGPYARVRHPSIIFKLAGVIGLGCAFGSLSFIFMAVPLLLMASLYFNRKGQEDPLSEKFGPVYEQYRSRTPALIPRLSPTQKEIPGES